MTAEVIIQMLHKFKKSIYSGEKLERHEQWKILNDVECVIALNKITELSYSAEKFKPFKGTRVYPVKIRPCAEEYENKTFFGLYLGDVATGFSMVFSENKLLLDPSSFNPAIFVPVLGKIIYGYESWWGKINSEDELSDITDSDISNVWYMKLLKDLTAKKG